MKKEMVNKAKDEKEERYINKQGLAKVQSKRLDNYSEELLKSLEQYGEEIGTVLLSYNKTSTEKTMGVRWLRNSSRRIQNRKNHQDMVEMLAVECAKKLGLNVETVRLMARNHDIGHTFLGHGGEWFLSNIKEEYGLGEYTHNALGPKELIYRYHIYDEMLENIKEFNPDITEGELTRIKRSLWLIFDGINSHNGELSETEFKPNSEKTEKDFEEEIMKCHTEKGFDRTIMPATIEGCLIRMCDKIAYTPFDMVDGLYEGFIDGINGEYVPVLLELGITEEEINEANIKQSYEKIARKLQIIFLKSVIENSSNSAIRMDTKTSKLMHTLRNINNKEIIDLEVLKEDHEVYPNAIRNLMNHFADLTLDNFFMIEDIRQISTDLILTNSIMRKFKGTPDEGFVKFIVTTTPEIYDFDKEMIEKTSESSEKSGKSVNLNFDRKMALEFGAEYLSTLSDMEFLNLLVSQKMITETQLKSLTRTYKSIGKQGLIDEHYVHDEWAKITEKQRQDTEKIEEKTR